MRFLPLFACATVLAVSAFAPSFAQAEGAKSFSDAEKAQIEEVVRDLLKKDPNIVIEAAQSAQQKVEADRQAASKTAVVQNRDELLTDKKLPVGGNPKGDVTVVEFFDYQCGYCKLAQETVLKLLAEDKNVRLVYKEFPILGEISTLASKAAVASAKQSAAKYIKFHDNLMAAKGHLSAEIIDQIAKDSGLNLDTLHKDMATDDVTKTIGATIALGAKIGARGTPVFIIGDKMVPGAVDYDIIKGYVADTRGGKK